MELGLFGRVLWRFRFVVILGVIIGAVLSTLSYYSVGLNGYKPKLTPRAQETWQADATILLTQHGFPEGSLNGSQDMGRFIGLAPLYAKMANSDAVRKLILKDGPLGGTYTVIPAADTSYGSVNGLPAMTIIGRADNGKQALVLTQRSADAFLTYLVAQEEAADIAPRARIDAQLLNTAGNLTLIVPRKKTLPIVVFLGVVFATIALSFVLENARRRPSAQVAGQAGVSIKDLGRSA